MVNAKRPWRSDLKEAYDRSMERGLLLDYQTARYGTVESGRAPAWGVGGVGSNPTSIYGSVTGLILSEVFTFDVMVVGLNRLAIRRC